MRDLTKWDRPVLNKYGDRRVGGIQSDTFGKDAWTYSKIHLSSLFVIICGKVQC
jgi:hypothetical protein